MMWLFCPIHGKNCPDCYFLYNRSQMRRMFFFLILETNYGLSDLQLVINYSHERLFPYVPQNNDGWKIFHDKRVDSEERKYITLTLLLLRANSHHMSHLGFLWACWKWNWSFYMCKCTHFTEDTRQQRRGTVSSCPSAFPDWSFLT